MIYLENVPCILEKNIYSVTTRWNILYMSPIYLVYGIIQILEKEMATHTPVGFPVLLLGKFHGWRSPVGYSPCDHRIGHEKLHFLSFYSSFWRRKWQCTPLFLPGESHGQRGLVGYSLWGCKESDTTKQPTHTHTHTHTHIGHQILLFIHSKSFRTFHFLGTQFCQRDTKKSKTGPLASRML